jgi:hypothetical protein
MSHIFISYSRKDLDFAQKIVNALAENKLDTWIDWKSIPKGEDWEQEIYRGIEEADAFLFLISRDSVRSNMCSKEIDHAVKNGKRIIPIVIRSTRLTTPLAISKPNWIFCREGRDDFDKAIEETHKTINTDYDWLKYHTELQVKALKWEQKRDTSRLLRGRELREAEQQLTEISNHEDPQPTKLQREYVLASQRSEIRTRRQITIGLVTGLAIMIMLSIVAWGQRNEAKSQQATAQAASTQAIAQESTAKANEAEAKRQAEIASSRQYATLAWYYINDQYDLSALFSVEAIQITHTKEAQTVLQNGVQQHTNIRYLPGPINQVTVMSFSKDGELFVAASCEGDLDANTLFCQESKIWLWEIPSRQQIGLPISVPGKVNRLLITPDRNTLIAGVCHRQQDTNYCNQEVWVWDILSPKSTYAPLVISEKYPLHMDINDNNILAVASCRQQQETDEGFRCLQSEIGFFDLKSDQFVYKPVLFDEVLGPLAFTADNSLVLSRCTTMNEIGNGCFQSEIQIMDIRTSAMINGPYSLGIDYPLDILPSDFNEIYISACHESEDLGPCAQPRIWRWDTDTEEPVSYWRPDIMPTRLSMFDYELLVLSPSAIEAQQLEEARNYYLLNLASNDYSGMIFNPEISTAAAFHKDGEILLINLGSDNVFGDLTVTDDTDIQDLIASACEIAGRNFTKTEWAQNFPDEPYHNTCPQYPAGQ